MEFEIVVFYFLIPFSVSRFEWPDSCKVGQYYEPSLMQCSACPANVSMVTSSDGFGCSCADHSIPQGVLRCKDCNVTHVVSADGQACVPRRCQQTAGKVACRKCPGDYISVTQNFDGSPMKEVLCVKCAKGFKVNGNTCIRCPSCICSKAELAIGGVCITKRFVSERPKQEEVKYHPNLMTNIVKNEYLCTQNNVRACRALTSDCIVNSYPSDLPGPCRMWIQPNFAKPSGLPPLIIDSKDVDKRGEFLLTRGMDKLVLLAAKHNSNAGLILQRDFNLKSSPCSLPIEIYIGRDLTHDCNYNISEKVVDISETIAPYIYIDEDPVPVPVSIKKSNGYYVQRGTWPSTKFRRYFEITKIISPVGNYTSTVYLRTLLIKLRLQREVPKVGSLRVQVSIESHYMTRSQSDVITTTLKVEHDMPTAGVLKGLEIWGGVLGSLSALYAMVQWRGVVRRGGLYVAIVPLLAASIADSLYFAALFSALHALAAEAGTLGITLPLSRSEENMVRAFVISAAALKALKVAWLNWHQSRCDLFFLDWSEYTNSLKGADKSNSWHASTVAREWSSMQTKRRASPWFTVTFAFLILHIMSRWVELLPKSMGYQWAASAVAWWCSYIIMLTARWILDRLSGSPASLLPKVCRGAGLSMIAFQEEYYAHYVHGRNDECIETRSIAGPLSMCRVVCAPQLRIVYKQLLLSSLGGLGDAESRQALLSRFLAAFFERALDGLSWVASERTILERLLDIELLVRESGNTSTLLYDPENNTPSCFALTWWGEEWTLGTFDAMVFGCVVVVNGNHQLAALVTLILWQIAKYSRQWISNRNIKNKTDIHINDR